MHISYFLYTICISALKTTVYAVLRFITIITFGIKIVNKKLLGINIFTHEKRYTSMKYFHTSVPQIDHIKAILALIYASSSSALPSMPSLVLLRDIS